VCFRDPFYLKTGRSRKVFKPELMNKLDVVQSRGMLVVKCSILHPDMLVSKIFAGPDLMETWF
jgi:hypothetical protein